MFCNPLPCVIPQGHNIFSKLSSREYSFLMQLLKQSILATDLMLYFLYVLYCVHQMGFDIDIFEDIVSYNSLQKPSAIVLVVLPIYMITGFIFLTYKLDVQVKNLYSHHSSWWANKLTTVCTAPLWIFISLTHQWTKWTRIYPVSLLGTGTCFFLRASRLECERPQRRV